ncbi:protein rep [Alloscardovia omnicolens]|uniref:protein rep n=1 Tax=Alloscardovia omnicolens TaxID=419015 RepID=UPI000668F574|nr:protein rep [Alloscardovia omnicolens]
MTTPAQDQLHDLELLGNSKVCVKSASLWQLRRTMQKVSSRKVLKDCGHVLNRAVAVQKLKKNGAGAFGGLTSCSNVWCCPVCSSKISAYRTEQLSNLVDWAKRHNYVISFLTLTMQHDKTQKLKDNWDILVKAFSRTNQSLGFRNFRKDVLVGYVKATEITYGANGWHVHFHIIFITKKNPLGYICNKRGDLLSNYLIDIFEKNLKKNGVGFSRKYGFDWQVVVNDTAKIVALYTAKVHGDISKELTLGNFKNARVKENRTIFQILADIKNDNFTNKQDIAIYREFEKASYHKTQLQYSRGLLKSAQLEDLEDEEILNQQDERDTLFFIQREDWQKIQDTNAPALILHAIKRELTKDTLSG